MNLEPWQIKPDVEGKPPLIPYLKHPVVIGVLVVLGWIVFCLALMKV